KKMLVIITAYIMILVSSILPSMDEIFTGITYTMLMVMGIFMLVIYTNGYDDRNKTEIVINSFPIKKADIVRGKYLTLVLYMIIICGILFLSSNLLRGLFTRFQGGKSATLGNVIVATNITLLFYAIYYPIYFRVGEDIMTFNYILWFLVLASPSLMRKLVNWLIEKGMMDQMLNINLIKANLTILIISIIVFYISLQISKKLYKQREF